MTFDRVCSCRDFANHKVEQAVKRDVFRAHGPGVAAGVWRHLSSEGRAIYQDETFKNMQRCRSTWELDRCTAEEISGCPAVQSGVLTDADLFRRVCHAHVSEQRGDPRRGHRRWRA